MSCRLPIEPSFEALEPRLLLSAVSVIDHFLPEGSAGAVVVADSLSGQVVAARPFERLRPLGSLVSVSLDNSGSLDAVGNGGDYQFFGQENETISAVATPVDEAVTLALELVGVSNLFSATTAGEPAVLPATALSADAPYVIRVSGTPATTPGSSFTLDIYRNAALELQVGDSGTDNALSIDSSALDFAARRLAVVGTSGAEVDDPAPIADPVYVVSRSGAGTGGVVEIFDEDNNLHGVIDDPIFDTGVISDAELGPDGHLFVSLDRGGNGINGSLIEFTGGGQFIRSIPVPDDTASSALLYPTGFEVLADGTFLVPKPNSGLIQHLDANGSLIGQSSVAGIAPVDVAVNDSAILFSDINTLGQQFLNIADDQFGWMAYLNRHDSELFDPTLTFLGITRPGNAPVDPQESADLSLFVTNSGDATLRKYSEAGLLQSFAVTAGTPVGLAVASGEVLRQLPFALGAAGSEILPASGVTSSSPSKPVTGSLLSVTAGGAAFQGGRISARRAFVPPSAPALALVQAAAEADIDRYTLQLASGQRSDVVLVGLEGVDFSNELLQLLGPDGSTVLATAAPNVGNFDLAILDYVPAAAGTYALQLISSIRGAYSLVVTEGGILETEPNDQPSETLRLLNGSSAALGLLGDAVGPGVNRVVDGGFELGRFGGAWNEFSTNTGTPICSVECGLGGGSGPHSGDFWAWFGGLLQTREVAIIDQDIGFPLGTTTLKFFLEIPVASGTGLDFLDVKIDDVTVYSAGDQNVFAYTEIVLDVSQFGDGGVHNLKFDSITAGTGITSYFVDNVELFGGSATTGHGAAETPGASSNEAQERGHDRAHEPVVDAAAGPLQAQGVEQVHHLVRAANAIGATDEARFAKHRTSDSSNQTAIEDAGRSPAADIEVESGQRHASLPSARSEQEDPAAYQPGRLIVRFDDALLEVASVDLISQLGGNLLRPLPSIHGALVGFDGAGVDPFLKAAQWMTDSSIVYAEPDYLLHANQVFPNDALFGDLWGLHNTGQDFGTFDVDIDAPEAWQNFTGSSNVVIASIDTGVNYAHPDLAANMWINPGEIPGDGIDNDLNGYIDDVHGIDTLNNDSDPNDDNEHGTHTAGTLAGVGNNGIGIAGVNWNAQIMALKFLGSDGMGSISGAVEAIEYMTLMKTRAVDPVNIVVSNNSWSGGLFSQALRDAISASNDAGILFVAAAGNGGADSIGDDTDLMPEYPASYDLDGIVAVGASDRNDQVAGFSNFGATSVDLFAPGVSILSTALGSGYQILNGTSMATPHVAGAAAMLMAANPGASLAQVKAAILSGVDPVAAFNGVSVSGGRLNLANAMAQIASLGPVVITTTPAAEPTNDLDITQITVEFSEPVTSATALDSGNYQLFEAGDNGLVGDGDDRAIALAPAFDGQATVTLMVAAEDAPLALGRYQLTIASAITDLEGNPLNATDGPGSGSATTVVFDVVFDVAPGSDLYLLELSLGQTAAIHTQTPFDHASATPQNDLDPRLLVVGPDGLPVAGDADSLDGRNSVVSFTALQEGRFTVQVIAQAGFGEYVLHTQLVPPGVVDRQLFYNDSSLDGDPGAGAGDDQAIAIDKVALRPGQVARVSNYSEFGLGTNGVMVDIPALPVAGLTAADFLFEVAAKVDATEWTAAPDPIVVDTRRGAGLAGSDRVTVIWANQAIENQWLRVTVESGPATGLTEDDVFYFGHQRLEGDANKDGIVTGTDLVAVQKTIGSAGLGHGLLFGDANYDGQVSGLDLLAVQANFGSAFNVGEVAAQV